MPEDNELRERGEETSPRQRHMAAIMGGAMALMALSGVGFGSLTGGSCFSSSTGWKKEIRCEECGHPTILREGERDETCCFKCRKKRSSE